MDELVDAIHRERLRDVKGFGPKTEENILHGVRLMQQAGDRVHLNVALDLAEEIVAELSTVTGCLRCTHAGSLRRFRETIGDVDILAAADTPAPLMDAFSNLSYVTEVIVRGEKKTSIRTTKGLQVDLRVVPPHAWGAALQYFTGSKAHNIRTREIAVHAKLKLSEYGLFRADTGDLVVSETEEEVYDRLGLPWIPPPLREDRGEIEAALRDELPALVRACENPCVNIIGHPTARQIGRRPAIDADLDEVFRACARTGTALEINSFPDRLDLRDQDIRLPECLTGRLLSSRARAAVGDRQDGGAEDEHELDAAQHGEGMPPPSGRRGSCHFAVVKVVSRCTRWSTSSVLRISIASANVSSVRPSARCQRSSRSLRARARAIRASASSALHPVRRSRPRPPPGSATAASGTPKPQARSAAKCRPPRSSRANIRAWASRAAGSSGRACSRQPATSGNAESSARSTILSSRSAACAAASGSPDRWFAPQFAQAWL